MVTSNLLLSVYTGGKERIMSEDCFSTILIVEDEVLWQRNLASLLQRANYQTVQAFDYSDALVQLQNLSHLPILAIVDLVLPNSNNPEKFVGYQMLDYLRQRGIYAIVLSAHIPRKVTFFEEHPEIIDVVDKLRFTDQDFESFFLEKVITAVSLAQDARQAEGKTQKQQQKLQSFFTTK